MSKASVSYDVLVKAREEWDRNERLKRQAERLEQQKKDQEHAAHMDAELQRAGYHNPFLYHDNGVMRRFRNPT